MATRRNRQRIACFFVGPWKLGEVGYACQLYVISRREPAIRDSGSSVDRSWFITRRWQQFEGEARANLLRIIAIGVFYLIHLWHYLSSQGKLPNWGFLQLGEAGEVDWQFHMLVTLLALAWITLAAAVHMALRARMFPSWLPTVSTVGDVLFLTSVLCVSAGPRSPLVVGYFLVIALAALRFDLKLVRLATIGAALGYVCVLGVAKWPERFGRDAEVDLTVPRFHQLVFLAALVLTGVIVGQVVRRLAEEYAARASAAGEETP